MPPAPRRLLAPVLALVLAGVLAGCGGGGNPVSVASSPVPVVAPTSAPAAPSLAPCPGGPTALQWPTAIPADLPKPPSATDGVVTDSPDGLTIVKFTTTTSLRESILFLIDALPAAGFTLGRGDAEATEADAPFVKGDVRGILRMIAPEPCRTDWLVAVTRQTVPAGGPPLLPVRPSTSPLPFG